MLNNGCWYSNHFILTYLQHEQCFCEYKVWSSAMIVGCNITRARENKSMLEIRALNAICRKFLAVVCATSDVHIVVGRSLEGCRSCGYSISCEEQEESLYIIHQT